MVAPRQIRASDVQSAVSTATLGRQIDYLITKQTAAESTGLLPGALASTVLEMHADRGVLNASGASPAGGDAIASWADPKGGLVASQATAGSRPTWTLAALDAQPALTFNGSQSLSIPDTANLRPDSGSFRVFVVARSGMSKSAQSLLSKGNATSSAVGYNLFYDSSTGLRSVLARCAGASSTRGSQYLAPGPEAITVYELALDGSTVTGLIQGSTAGFVSGGGGPASNAYTAPISNTDALVIGNGFVGDIFAIVILKAPSASDIIATRTYLMARYRNVPPPSVTYGSEVAVWTQGVEYPFVRIPAACRCNDGTILQFIEGRQSSTSDTGFIELAMKRSTNGGASYGPKVILASDGSNTFGNPAPIVDRRTGRVYLLFCGNLAADTEAAILAGTATGTRKVYEIYSDDSGQTWSARREVTSLVKLPAWRWYATAPGGTEQLANGRLLVPACHSDPALGAGTDNTSLSSHMIYRDAGGDWQIGANFNAASTYECRITQLSTGRVICSLRSDAGSIRRTATSDDFGLTFTTPVQDNQLLHPACNCDVKQLPGDLLLHSGPRGVGSARVDLVVRLSRDLAANWPASTVISAGSGAYSDMTPMPDGGMLLTYEKGSPANIVAGKIATGVIYPRYLT